MTAAHTTLFTQLLDLLDHVPYLGLRRARTAPDEFGYVDFETRTVTISDQASVPQAAVTLMHEIRHLRRGACYVGDEDADEAEVVDETARLLVPGRYLPAAFEAVDVLRLAAELGVTAHTVRHAVALARRDQAKTIGEVA